MKIILEPIISGPDSYFKNFIIPAIKMFYDELELYSEKNNDFRLLSYCNERTLASMLVNGLIRNDAKNQRITSVQEYGIPLEKSHGRPDIFIRFDTTAIWIEAKFQRDTNLTEQHWEIEPWIEWEDREKIFKQVNDYYQSEVKYTNSSYENHYIMTLVFKQIKEIPDVHMGNAEHNLNPRIKDPNVRDWYYSVGFINEDDAVNKNGKQAGIEVYGTFKKMK